MSETVYRSECGEYLCRYLGDGHYDAWRADGAIHWRHDGRVRTWAEAKKAQHPMAYGVGGFSATRTGQQKGSFTLTLLHCDTEKTIVPYMGNTIIDRIEVVFRRKVPPLNVPHWISAATVHDLTPFPALPVHSAGMAIPRGGVA